jgi:uncharacterized membrane protein required for colicin V production
MNWFDIALITLLLVATVIGSKKGLIRELMAFFALLLGVVVTTNNMDFLALEIARHINASPLVIALISFVVMLAVMYGLFRLAAYAFYKVADLQNLGRKDKVGGAVVGTVRGWIVLGLTLFLLSLLPMPSGYFAAVDGAVLAKPMMKTMPLLFDGTVRLHPRSGSFVEKVNVSVSQTEQVLQQHHKKSYSNPTWRNAQRDKVDQALAVFDKYFGSEQMP